MIKLYRVCECDFCHQRITVSDEDSGVQIYNYLYSELGWSLVNKGTKLECPNCKADKVLSEMEGIS